MFWSFVMRVLWHLWQEKQNVFTVYMAFLSDWFLKYSCCGKVSSPRLWHWITQKDTFPLFFIDSMSDSSWHSHRDMQLKFKQTCCSCFVKQFLFLLGQKPVLGESSGCFMVIGWPISWHIFYCFYTANCRCAFGIESALLAGFPVFDKWNTHVLSQMFFIQTFSCSTMFLYFFLQLDVVCTTHKECLYSSSGSSSQLRRRARNMKSMRPPSAAIIFMTCLYKAGGWGGGGIAPGSATDIEQY